MVFPSPELLKGGLRVRKLQLSVEIAARISFASCLLRCGLTQLKFTASAAAKVRESERGVWIQGGEGAKVGGGEERGNQGKGEKGEGNAE